MKDKHWVATICYFIGNVTWHHSCLTVAPAEIWSQQSQVLHMSSMGLWILRCKLQHNIFATLWLMARFQSPARTLGLTSVYIFFVWGVVTPWKQSRTWPPSLCMASHHGQLQGMRDEHVRDGVQGWLEISVSALFDDSKSIFRRGRGSLNYL